MIPTLTIKYWTGGDNEYFDYEDMNRVNRNANIISKEAGTTSVSFADVKHDSQFDYSEFQKLENFIRTIAGKLGVSVSMVTTWGVNRSVSYVDFERVEKALFDCYKKLGGIGERVPADKRVSVVKVVLGADKWTPDYPYFQDFLIADLRSDMSASVFLSTPNNSEQFAEMTWGLLRVKLLSNYKVRVYADGKPPNIDVPITIITELLSMEKKTVLTVGGWSGTGPWVQTIPIDGTDPSKTIGQIGQDERSTPSSNTAFIQALPRVKAFNVGSVVIEATGKKPTVDIPVVVLYENDLTDVD